MFNPVKKILYDIHSKDRKYHYMITGAPWGKPLKHKSINGEKK